MQTYINTYVHLLFLEISFGEIFSLYVCKHVYINIRIANMFSRIWRPKVNFRNLSQPLVPEDSQHAHWMPPSEHCDSKLVIWPT